MSTGAGDKLASGGISATFPSMAHLPQEEWDAKVGGKARKEKPKPWCWCKDCNRACMTGEEFTAHIRVCPKNPLP
jgi:hypothetical protein